MLLPQGRISEQHLSASRGNAWLKPCAAPSRCHESAGLADADDQNSDGPAGASRPAGPSQQSERCQTERRDLPRLRRLRITRRPVWVRILTLKPETRLRLRLVPPRVRFVIGFLRRPACRQVATLSVGVSRYPRASCRCSPTPERHRGLAPGR